MATFFLFFLGGFLFEAVAERGYSEGERKAWLLTDEVRPGIESESMRSAVQRSSPLLPLPRVGRR